MLVTIINGQLTIVNIKVDKKRAAHDGSPAALSARKHFDFIKAFITDDMFHTACVFFGGLFTDSNGNQKLRDYHMTFIYFQRNGDS